MKQEITALRQAMLAAGVDAYIIPTEDFHGSEYVGDYFKCRSYVSGFTGSAGTLVVTASDALLWTDGRYFLQAADQLAGTGITLMKMREPGVPTIEAWLGDHLTAGQTLTCAFPLETEEKAETVRETAYTVRWRGPDVVGIDPPGDHVRLYQRDLRVPKALPTPDDGIFTGAANYGPTQQKQ